MSSESWWYLSFAGDTGFLGAAVVRGDDMAAAVREAHRLKVNPGGEVLGLPIPADDPEAARAFPPEKRNRLLSREEIDGGKSLKDLDPIEEDRIDAASSIVCEDCNPT